MFKVVRYYCQRPILFIFFLGGIGINIFKRPHFCCFFNFIAIFQGLRLGGFFHGILTLRSNLSHRQPKYQVLGSQPYKSLFFQIGTPLVVEGGADSKFLIDPPGSGI